MKKTNTVDFRRRETANWQSAGLNLELYEGDSLRTLDGARARVKFLTGGILAMDANSLAIIKPPKSDYDVNLERGSVFVGQARVVTASARVEPKTKDTQYMARVADDLSTVVEVYHGRAAISAQGQTVDVNAGMASVVRMGLAPEIPRKIADLAGLKYKISEMTGSSINSQLGSSRKPAERPMISSGRVESAASVADDLRALKVGIPISGYRVQASVSPSFNSVAFDKFFDSEQKFSPADANLAPGVYWWRIALVDLLGVQEKFSAPRQYSIGR
ncbi:MAG: FecR family protein [Elusimicrobiota bacterium]